MIATPIPRSIDTYNESPSGDIDNINNVFLTFSDFHERSTRLFLNGMRMKLGLDNDYVEMDSGIIFNLPPMIGDSIIIDYSHP